MPKSPRRWIKLNCNEWLRGTIRFICDSEERGVVNDLDALAGDCGMNGLIAASENQPFSRRWIAGTLNITENLLERVLEKLKNLPSDEYYKMSEDAFGLRFDNWPEHQSEYDRQKKYRQPKILTAKLINEMTAKLGRHPTQQELYEVLEDDLTDEEKQKILDIASRELK